ncbi:MAG: YdcF family protein [Candidatus Nanopelagicales bacterium]
MTTPAVLLEWSPATPRRVSLRGRGRRRFALIALLFVATIVSVPAAALGSVWYFSQIDDRTPTDAIVVLGAAQYQGVPSPVLANRLSHTEELVRAGVASQVITVGGFRTGDVTSEAQVSKEEMIAEGLRSRQIIAIPFGQDTKESLEAVATVAGEQGIHSVTLVSDPAHMARSRALAKQVGLDAHVSPTEGGPGSALTTQYLLRETAGLLMVWFNRL